MKEQPRRPRGRPRLFNLDTALHDAQDAFWRSGYAGTSLDDLAAAMGMNRPSIYAAFGDKEALYLKSAERYAQESCRQLEQALQGPGTLRERLAGAYAGAIAFYIKGGPEAPRGCFLVGTGVTQALTSSLVRGLLEATFDAFRGSFSRAFRRARREQELSAVCSADSLAQIAASTLNTLALRARTGATRATLEQLAAATVEVVCSPATDARRNAERTVKGGARRRS
jgi:TetR/AcrR family transcriptional regulator, copper-responsive repressor